MQVMGGSRKISRGGQPNIVGIKVAQLNVLLELQLRTSLVISQIRTSIVSYVTPGWAKVTFGGARPLGPPLNLPMMQVLLNALFEIK